jgi:ribosomal protein S6
MDKELEQIGADARVYEAGFLIVSTVAEGDLGARVTAIRDIIEGNGGKMISDEYPKSLDLAYPMVKVTSNKRAIHHSAYFGWMKFDAEPKGAKAIDSALKADDKVLRHILIKTIRENTIVPKKLFREKPREEVSRPADSSEPKPVLSEEELDKTIEELVIS